MHALSFACTESAVLSHWHATIRNGRHGHGRVAQMFAIRMKVA